MFKNLDGWIRSRLRMCQFKRWPKPRTRVREMKKLGLSSESARGYGRNKQYWHMAEMHITRFAMNNVYWEERMEYEAICKLLVNRLGTEPYAGWCERTGLRALLLDF